MITDTTGWTIAAALHFVQLRRYLNTTVYVNETLQLLNAAYRGVRLLQRASTRNLRTLGLEFDVAGGLWGRPDNLWALDTNPIPPYNVTTGQFSRSPPQPAHGISWDIGHSIRLVPWGITINELVPQLTGVTDGKFQGSQLLSGWQTQVFRGAWNGNVSAPLFSNYISGQNGWYRVQYHARDTMFAPTPPYGLTAYVPRFYGLWQRNSQVRALWNTFATWYSNHKLPDDVAKFYSLTPTDVMFQLSFWSGMTRSPRSPVTPSIGASFKCTIPRVFEENSCVISKIVQRLDSEDSSTGTVPSSSSNSTKIAVIVLSSVGVAILLLAIAVAIFLWHQRKMLSSSQSAYHTQTL